MSYKGIIVIIDCGHGGINHQGKYTTAPYKMFKFPDGSVIHEGVTNRETGGRVKRLLDNECIKTTYTVHPDDPTDLSLKDRVEIEHKLQEEGYRTIFVSFHSNASQSHEARGFEIWTSVGQTKSDILADFIGEEVHNEFPQMKFRRDMIDGDIDKESQFYVLKNTIGAAVLIENLFFDNREDADLLRSDLYQKRVSKAIAKGIFNYIYR